MDSLYLFPPDGNTPKKTCTGPCGRTLDATNEYFYSNSKGKYGLLSKCKICTNAQRKENYSRPEVKERANAQKKEYRSRPEVKAHISEYNKSHEVKRRQKARRSRPEVKEQTKVQQKEYYSRPEVRAHRQNWGKEYEARPEVKERRRGAHQINEQKRRARKKAVLGTYTHEHILDQLKRQKYKCYYCQKRLQKAKGKYVYHIEHTFPLSRVAGSDIPANNIDYLVLACPACNLSKHNKFPWEWPEGGRLL